MYRFAGAVFIATALTLPLAGCESINSFDPMEWIPGDIFNSKKKLAGERKPIFPEGVPGTAPGVPPELMRNPQAAGDDAQNLTPPAQRAAVEPEPKSKAKARPKAPPKQQAAAPERSTSTPTSVTVRPAPSAAPQPAPQQPAAQWPDPPGTQRAPAGPGGIQWPEPPPTR